MKQPNSTRATQQRYGGSSTREPGRCTRPIGRVLWPGLLIALALLLQACNSLAGDTGQFRPALTASAGGGTPLEVNSDGRFHGKIAFTHGHRLYLLDGATGSIRPLPAGDAVSDPAYSPDGTRLAYISRGAGWSDLLVLPSAGGAPTALTHSQGSGTPITCASGVSISDHLWVASPVWSADGSLLYYLADGQGHASAACGYADMGIWQLSAAGGEPHMLLAPASGAESGGLPGAGGDADLSLRPGPDPALAYTHYAYAPQDGTTLLIQLFLGTLDGQQELALSPSSLNAAPEQVQQPAWSPDGQELAFIRQDTGGMDLAVMHVSNPASGAPTFGDYAAASKLLEGQISHPVWSPDGTALLFLAFKDNEYNLYLVHLARTNQSISVQGSPLQLTQGGVDGDSRPAWSST